jgi:hypothetical protein
MIEMKLPIKFVFVSAAGVVLWAAGYSTASATEPCGDFDECKVLIEINSSDGDIGFHWSGDAGDLRSMRIDDPSGAKIFENKAFSALRDQKLTETFGESAEPLCWPDPDAEEEDLEEIVTLRDFREQWEPGTYVFTGKGEEGEMISGETELTYDLPAAPQDLDFSGNVISWAAGNDLGNCAPLAGGVGQETIAEVLDIITDSCPRRYFRGGGTHALPGLSAGRYTGQNRGGRYRCGRQRHLHRGGRFLRERGRRLRGLNTRCSSKKGAGVGPLLFGWRECPLLSQYAAVRLAKSSHWVEAGDAQETWARRVNTALMRASFWSGAIGFCGIPAKPSRRASGCRNFPRRHHRESWPEDPAVRAGLQAFLCRVCPAGVLTQLR